MTRPTCTYRNTAVKIECDKPAVAWANGLFSLGLKVYFCTDCLKKAQTRVINSKRQFHRIEP